MSTNKHTLPLIHVFTTLLISSILLGFSSQSRANWISSPINFLLTPLRIPFISLNTKISSLQSSLSNIPHQQRLINDLKRQNAQLSLTAQLTKNLQEENKALRSTLSSPITPDYTLLPAKVVGLARYATLNLGQNSDLTPNLPVTVNNILLGFTKNTSLFTTSVALLADPDTSIPVSTLNNASGLLTFINGDLVIGQVLQRHTLEPGEPVFTAGATNTPDGLLVGHIQTIQQSDSQIHQSATINPASSITQHPTVFVILR